ncbi:twin-arginine translocation pathway signal protein [Siccirubricoccus sp. KC 17139]|uniref:Twin-arginine translocation pathway signal protein n=1 Tax=Siccirubricoccus soli TaxID=2899147 RepID=A0ABT1CY29_9PROT|nr:tripartite tricarboxylate transporter substrate-binding protein [Siccirubricoccus soli]MCO6414575.1 twin-arginine translocation pathway signal protein [Siccirubricoccus soli]MCP2680705.1 tripartite tricarboxylate transporter substrate-binding protein [Siccirubricoccus soli]
MKRRTWLAAALAAPSLASSRARAQWAPPRQVRLLVPFTPGGGADTTARLFAPIMTNVLGQPVVVENRGGAGGTIGAGEAARAAPDGATLLLDAANQAVAPFIFRNLAFDYATAFTPISRVTVYPLIIVVKPDSAIRSFPDLLERARAQPGRLTYSSSGTAVSNHIAAAVLAQRAAIDITHVPYRGGGPALQAILAGDVDFGFATVAAAAALAQQGGVQPLAASSAERIPALPEVPTIAEQGFPGYDQTEWNALYGPAGLPAAATERLYEACRTALADAGVQQRLVALGAIGLGTPPAEFAAWLAKERHSMQALVRAANITAD